LFVMSDLQSVPAIERRNVGKAPLNRVDKNAVLQRVLQRLEAEARSKLVLRCADLPMTAVEEESLEGLFCGLLQMILQKRDEVATLFLHISCATEEQTPLARSGSAFFTVQFKTNIIPCTNWFDRNKDRLDELEATVASYRGKLVVNKFKSSGYIFSVSLPGKVV